MRALSEREKRTIRFAAILIAVYLVGFYGVTGWRFLRNKQVECSDLQFQADTLVEEIGDARYKAGRLKELKKILRIDLEKMHAETVVVEAREAIHKAAKSLGLQLGSSKETRGRSSGRELALLEIVGQGPTVAVVHFLNNLKGLGFPVVVDRLHISVAKGKPGLLDLSLTVAVLNFTKWKQPGERNA